MAAIQARTRAARSDFRFERLYPAPETGNSYHRQSSVMPHPALLPIALSKKPLRVLSA
jgi:hypothetical protein